MTADPYTPKVKICGLRDVESALAAADAGADFLGFNFIEGVRRQLQPHDGQMLVRGFRIRGHRRRAGGGAPRLRSGQAGQASAHDVRPEPVEGPRRDDGAPRLRSGQAVQPLLVGLFRNQDAGFVNEVTRMADLDIVHLCGEEDEAYIRSMWKPVFRQVRVRAGTTPGQLAAEVQPHLDAGRYVVLDRYDENTPGGAGVAFDWSAADGVASQERVLLAGGLTPENIRSAITRLRPWGVDVSSGVETDGVKDHDKIRAFVAAAKGVAPGGGRR